MEQEFWPSREVLVDVRDHLVRLRLECEEIGWWPGSGSTNHSPKSTPAPGTLYELDITLRDTEPLATPPSNTGKPFVDIARQSCWPVRGWPSFWAHEIRRVMMLIDETTHELMIHWDEFIRMTDAVIGYIADDSDSCSWESGALEFPLTSELLELVVPDGIAAILDLCRRRLETVLRDGPQNRDLFIPTPIQTRILEAIDCRAMTLESLAAKLDIDKSTLHRSDLKRLLKLGKVMTDRKLGGYYRPDAPPQ